MSGRALVVGVTGISGGNLAQRLLADGWEVAGVCRRPEGLDQRITPVTPTSKMPRRSPPPCAAALRPRLLHDLVAPGHRGQNSTSTARCSRTCSRRPLPSGSVRHVALVTGLKHYLGPFEAYATVPARHAVLARISRACRTRISTTCRRTSCSPRPSARLPWSVHRPHTLIGWALGNAMNMGVTLAVYAAICRETGRPLPLPGLAASSARRSPTSPTRGLLAEHLVWAATTPAAANRAFNIVNGDVFRWRWLWPRLADGTRRRAGAVSRRRPRRSSSRWPMPARSGPRSCGGTVCATSASTRSPRGGTRDADLGRTIETFTDMGHSRRLGFLGVRDSESSFTEAVRAPQSRADRAVTAAIDRAVRVADAGAALPRGARRPRRGRGGAAGARARRGRRAGRSAGSAAPICTSTRRPDRARASSRTR